MKSTTETQCAQILAYMREGHAITSLEALSLFGCLRLSARIHDLRDRGHAITSSKVATATGKLVAQYRMP